MTRQERMHAIVAWLYIRECARVCPQEAATDYAFARFVVDMKEAYPDEFKKVEAMND